MNVGLISLILLVVAIAVGFVRNANVGILSIAFATIVCIVFKSGDINASTVVSGFGTSLFIQMVGVAYLFSIIKSNGTLELAAKKVVSLVPAPAIPVVMFLLGMVLSAAGPGSIPCLAIIPVISIPVAVSAGVNPIMTALIGDLGAMAGRMSPLTPEAIVIANLMSEQGMGNDTVPFMLRLALTSLVCAVITFIYYKGWKIEGEHGGKRGELPPFTVKNWASILALVILVAGVLGLGWNVGLTGFLVGSILIVLGFGDEKAVIAGIPWNVILMVMGVGMLMKILSLSDGIDLLVSALENVMGAKSAGPLMGLTAGLMSFFSSGLGVVFPTLVPVCGELAAGLGINGAVLVNMVAIGGTIAGFTPISTAGALIMAGVAQQEDSEGRFPQNRMFLELFGVSFLCLAITMLFSVLGVYGFLVH